jgi:hypothetical protein
VRPFFHIASLLENSEKWRLRDQESPPPRSGAPIAFDDDSDDAPAVGRNKRRLDGRRQAKLEVKRRAEQERLTSKMKEMVALKRKLPKRKCKLRRSWQR